MSIDIANRQRLVPIDKSGIENLGTSVLERVLGNGEWTATIAFVRDPVIRRLNRQYRGVSASTDVLSFPASDASAGQVEMSEGATESGEEFLGDVVISVDTASRQAAEAGIRLEREIEELVIHGILHICGYDHETDNGEMNRLEVKLRRKLLD